MRINTDNKRNMNQRASGFKRRDVAPLLMKTRLITFLTIAAAATAMAGDKPKHKKTDATEASTEQTTTATEEQKPTSVTRKQAQDAGNRPLVPEDAATTPKAAVKPDASRANRKQIQTEGKPAVKETSETTTTKANKAE